MAEDNNVPPLSTDDLRANASNWTLACDAGLLAHLEQFSQKIFEKAETTENSLNNLLDKVDQVTTNFNIVSNQFQSLQNSQFLENRVYDDETPTEDYGPPLHSQVEETQQQIVAKYKESVANGLQLLDSHFEQVEVPESSDSDDELANGGSTILLKPKVTYTQPLPLIIGSAEWWADDTVGLGDFLENEESEPELSFSDASPHLVEKRVRLTPSTSSRSSDEVMEENIIKSKVPETVKSSLIEPGSLLTAGAEQSETKSKPTDLFTAPGDLFGDESENLFSKPSGPTSSHFLPISSNAEGPNKVPISKKSTEGRKILFDEDEAGDDSIFKNESPPKIPKSKNPQVTDDFTKELFAKLGGVAKNTNVPSIPKAKVVQPASPSVKKTETTHKESQVENHVVPASKPKQSDHLFQQSSHTKSKGTGLFDDDEDDDFLFNGKTAPSGSLPGRSLVAPTKLFDDDVEEFLGPSVAANVVQAKNNFDEKPSGSSKKNQSSSIFGDSLFSEDLEGDLFSSSSNLPPKVANPRLVLPDSEKNSPVFVQQRGLTASTPSMGASSTPEFGSISRLEKIDSSQASYMPNNSENLLEDPLNDLDARIVENVQYDSRDLGFIESTDISEISNSENRESPANWFHPQLSSTRSAAMNNETSGYKTATLGTGASSTVTSSSTDASNIRNTKLGDQRISSVNEGDSNGSKSLKNNSSENKISRISNENIDNVIKNTAANESKSVLSSRPLDETDLFKAPSSNVTSAPNLPSKTLPHGVIDAKPTKAVSLFDDDDAEDLFSSKTTVSSKSHNEKSLSKDVSKGLTASLFTYDSSEDLFSEGPIKVEDNVSHSSNRSSLFEEPTGSKSTLPSIFGDKASAVKPVVRNSLFDDVDDDLDLFTKNVTKDSNNSKMAKSESVEAPNKDTPDLKTSEVKKSEPDKKLPTTKPTPPSSLNVRKLSHDLKVRDETDGEVVAVNKKIGKLNIPNNLKINPSALLPGAKPTKPTEKIQKNEGLVAEKLPKDEGLVAEKIQKDEGFVVPAESVADNESPSGHQNILSSTLKDRVRISVKRRPQSRRARQDALRTSGIDFSPTEDVSATPSPASVVTPESSSHPTAPSHNLVSPSTDEEDFHVPELDLVHEPDSFDNMLIIKEVPSNVESLLFNSGPVISPAAETANIAKSDPSQTHSTNAFKISTQLDEISDEVLFSSSTTTTASTSKNLKSNLFEDINDGDLFSSTKPTVSKSAANDNLNAASLVGKSIKPKNKTSSNISDSLFGDVEDDDDNIFFGKPSTSRLLSKPNTVSTSLPKPGTGDSGHKFVDPLGLFKEPED